MVQASRLTRSRWTVGAAACYPSTVGSLGPTPRSHGPTPNLERVGQQIATIAQPNEAQILFCHINTPTWVTSRRYPTRTRSTNNKTFGWKKYDAFMQTNIQDLLLITRSLARLRPL
ncbi:hypothetical protein CR513_07828, partial [Mucuna pruriens]